MRTRTQLFFQLTLLVPKTTNSFSISIQRVHQRPRRQIGRNIRTHQKHIIKCGIPRTSCLPASHGRRPIDGIQILWQELLPQIPNTIEISVM